MRNPKLLMGQHVMKTSGGMGGFNSRILGDTYHETFGYPAHFDRAAYAGFELADSMIMAGKLFYVQRFKHTSNGVICKGKAFPYGGSMVCNTCNRSELEKPWWTIKVQKDGNAWCCIGTDFEDLQASEDYAFGETRQDAIDKYEELMLSKELSFTE